MKETQVAIIFVDGTIYAARMKEGVAVEFCGPISGDELGPFIVSVKDYPDVGGDINLAAVARHYDEHGDWQPFPPDWPQKGSGLKFVWDESLPKRTLSKSAARFYKRHGEFSRGSLASLVLAHVRSGGALELPLGSLGVREDSALSVLFEPDAEVPYCDASVLDAIEYLLCTMVDTKREKSDQS